jgi:LmbE family N-acetylglucosaminyl deacetylase
MKLVAPLALALTLTAPLTAQTFTDPANLRGERPTPTNGRELPIDQGATGLAQLLRKLNTHASILNIVAHPDDEDGGMLTLYSRGLGVRVADLSLTRGEGGQNAVTGDFEDALGLLRTQELLSNDRYTGVDQMFGTEVDFGFSKTKEESFAKWTHERVLYDAVRAIRLVRPLVITATFIGGVTDGHGQHQVSGEIAQEAFKAAADPKVFPDQIAEGLLPWQALRVYARVPMGAITSQGLFDYATNQYTPARFTNYVTGEVTTTIPSTDVTVHEGATDPLLADESGKPRSYVQFARIGLGLQRSQIGPGVRNAPSGAFDVSYHLYGSITPGAPSSTRVSARQGGLSFAVANDRSLQPHLQSVILSAAEEPATKPAAPPTSEPSGPDPHDPTFFDGIDTSIEGIATLAPSAKGNVAIVLKTNLLGIQHSIAEAALDFKPDQPASAAHRLAEALTLTDTTIKNVDGFNPDQLPSIEKANVLHELRIKRVQLNDALILALGLSVDATALSSDLVNDSSPELKTTVTESSTETVKFNQIRIDGADSGQSQALHNELSSSRPLERLWQIPSGHLPPITQPYFYRDNIEQAIYKLRDPALRNAPATPSPLTAWASIDYQGTEITIGRIVHSGPQPVSIVPAFSIASSPTATVFPLGQSKAELTATLRTTSMTTANISVQSPRNWVIQARAATSLSTKTDHPIDFFVRPTAAFSQPQVFQVTAQTADHQTYDEGYCPVGYPGLPSTNYYTPATTRIVPVNLTLPEHHRIAYLPGTGDAVPDALDSINLTPTILTVADLTPTNLAQYDTVILGVRTYNAHPDLHGAPTQALLDYAKNGGNVLVQYQTAEFTAADAPYPLTLGNAEKVVDETDHVQLLDPHAQLFTTPNLITSADFDNWIEERGHGFLSTWDDHYTILTETHDPGQDPQRGGLITTQLGKGRWTYCAFALYRQLPEAVPGAYRLFVNLLDKTH